MAKTNAKVKVDKGKGKIYAVYVPPSKEAKEMIISCQSFGLTEGFSFIIFSKEQA